MKIPIILRFWEPRAGPKNSFWGSTYSFFFGSTTSGKTVNERTAYKQLQFMPALEYLLKQ